jgi:hypothetical protein
MELKELLGMLSATPTTASQERKTKKSAPQARPNLFGE